MLTIESLPTITASHLVKSVDLNHHGTLYAGRMAEWVVEVGFMTARAALSCAPQNIVCVRLHGMDFRKSVHSGSTIVLDGRVAYVGRSSLSVNVKAHSVEHQEGDPYPTEGFVTFVYIVDGQTQPHGLAVEPPETPEARRLWDAIVAERNRRT